MRPDPWCPRLHSQSCGFRDHYFRLRELGAEVVGLSAQTVAEQRWFAARVALPFQLIADPGRTLAAALGLPTFAAGGRIFYRRLCLLAERGLVVRLFDPIAAPERNAAEVVGWLKSRAAVEGST